MKPIRLNVALFYKGKKRRKNSNTRIAILSSLINFANKTFFNLPDNIFCNIDIPKFAT
jgi:hypothetical protein